MDYYDHISKGYDDLYKEEQLAKLSIIKNSIKINKDTKILDVGCGTGVSSSFDCYVAGLDPSIGLLIRNKNVRKINGLAESLPFKNNSFDLVICITAIHNFYDIKKSISEMIRVGKGMFVFSVLKKSKKFVQIVKLIMENFRVMKTIEEEKDMIYFCRITT